MDQSYIKVCSIIGAVLNAEGRRNKFNNIQFVCVGDELFDREISVLWEQAVTDGISHTGDVQVARRLPLPEPS